jgi:PKD domain-containing protein
MTLRLGFGTALGALALAVPAAQAAELPLFNVGAATRSIDPPPGVDIYPGGFGKAPALHDTDVARQLQVKAFYVERNGHAVAFAVVDCQAWFAAYQAADNGDPQPYGIADARADAAATVPGGKLAARAIVVQGTHSHAAATLEGIWGPVRERYLKLVHDQTVAAIAAAAASARPAHLQWGTVDAPYLDNIVTPQTDSYTGWTQDGQVTMLRAVAPGTGETIATFLNVPAHGDIVEGSGGKGILHPDYFGYVRDALEERLGGISVTGPATLGREETPVQVGGVDASHWFSGVVGELATRALGSARWVSDGTLSASSSKLFTPGANPALLALVAANHLPTAQKERLWNSAAGLYPINRADTPPWLTGTVLGTDLTSIRIGPLAYVSMPGESFPEVRMTIAKATQGAAAVIALNKGQDDMGYFYPAWVHPFTFVYDSDHWTYNVAPQFGDQVITQQLLNLGKLGFQTHPAVSTPMKTQWSRLVKAGLQAMASPARGSLDAGGRFTTTLRSIFNSAPYGSSPGQAEPVHWNFGDGTTADTRADKRWEFTHTYTTPGSYVIRLWTTDTEGHRYDWQVPVRVYEQLKPSIEASGADLIAHIAGGAPPMLAYRWSFDNGATANGERVALPAGATHATLRVTDAAGDVASASYP